MNLLSLKSFFESHSRRDEDSLKSKKKHNIKIVNCCYEQRGNLNLFKVSISKPERVEEVL